MGGEMTDREQAETEQMPVEQMLSRINEMKQELKQLEEAAADKKGFFSRLNPFKGGKRTKNKRKQSKRKKSKSK